MVWFACRNSPGNLRRGYNVYVDITSPTSSSGSAEDTGTASLTTFDPYTEREHLGSICEYQSLIALTKFQKFSPEELRLIDYSQGRKDGFQQLLEGYDKAYFLDSSYFHGFDQTQRDQFIQWLQETAGVATYPRLSTQFSSMHGDFCWLLQNRRGQILSLLRENWDSYKEQLTNAMIETIATHKFRSREGQDVLLRQTFIPLPSLLEKSQTFCDTDSFPFLDLPNGHPNEWKFLSRFGVGIEEDIDFYVWVLEQPSFKIRVNIDKAKNLYSKIQECGLSGMHSNKIR